MRIETAAAPGSVPQVKGDLLERLAVQLMQTQNYEVKTQVRLTATELDLLCEHRVNGRLIYVECKAFRDTLGAAPLKSLLGTINLKNYQEGWLISAGPPAKMRKASNKNGKRKQLKYAR